jgi:hypothetical protein
MTGRRLALAASLVIFAVSVSVSAADSVNGKWVANVPTAQGSMKLTFDLKADGSKLMGTLSNDFIPATPIAEGMIHGSDVSFKVAIEAGPGGKMTLNYKGMVKGDEMSLTRTFEGTPPQGSAPEMQFKAMREK